MTSPLVHVDEARFAVTRPASRKRPSAEIAKPSTRWGMVMMRSLNCCRDARWRAASAWAVYCDWIPRIARSAASSALSPRWRMPFASAPSRWLSALARLSRACWPNASATTPSTAARPSAPVRAIARRRSRLGRGRLLLRPPSLGVRQPLGRLELAPVLLLALLVLALRPSASDSATNAISRSFSVSGWAAAQSSARASRVPR